MLFYFGFGAITTIFRPTNSRHSVAAKINTVSFNVPEVSKRTAKPTTTTTILGYSL